MTSALSTRNGHPVSDNCGTQAGLIIPMVSCLPEAVPSRDWTGRYTEDLHRAYRLIAAHVYGNLGRFAYAAFDFINGTYFDGKLPETLLLWDLTEYGHCLGWTRSSTDGPPIIKIHPATVQPARRHDRHPSTARVWKYPRDWFGLCFAFDTLLHETIHASVNYLLGGWERLPEVKSYWSSHNNPLWVGELNRIAPRLGYVGDPFTMATPKRVPIPGQFTKTGKPKTRAVRRPDGDAPKVEYFPHNLPCRVPFYVAKQLPFPWETKPRQPRGLPTLADLINEEEGE
jgi:hypothetical protein